MEAQTFHSFYIFRKGMIVFPDFKKVQIGALGVLCPMCKTPMNLIYQIGKNRFYQCLHSHRGKRFVYMVGD